MSLSFEVYNTPSDKIHTSNDLKELEGEEEAGSFRQRGDLNIYGTFLHPFKN